MAFAGQTACHLYSLPQTNKALLSSVLSLWASQGVYFTSLKDQRVFLLPHTPCETHERKSPANRVTTSLRHVQSHGKYTQALSLSLSLSRGCWGCGSDTEEICLSCSSLGRSSCVFNMKHFTVKSNPKTSWIQSSHTFKHDFIWYWIEFSPFKVSLQNYVNTIIIFSCKKKKRGVLKLLSLEEIQY